MRAGGCAGWQGESRAGLRRGAFGATPPGAMPAKSAPTRFPDDPPITPELARSHKLTRRRVRARPAGARPRRRRTPSSASSASCGASTARTSRAASTSRRLPTKGPRVIQGPGENAGVVDIGDGFAAVFKMESHNHPSFIEPYQGAATGVGGILRDVFTMGARPIASLNSLRFGRPDHPRTAGAPPRRRRRHRRLRQLHRRAHRRRRGAVRRALRRQHPRQRLHVRRRPHRPHLLRARQRHRQHDPLHRREDRARRHPRRDDGERRVLRRRPQPAADDAGRRPLHGQAPPRGVPRALRARTCSRASRTWAPPGSRRRASRWPGAREQRPRARSRPRPAPREGDDAVRDPAQRVAGAHAPRREAGQGGRASSRSARSGTSTPPSSAT